MLTECMAPLGTCMSKIANAPPGTNQLPRSTIASLLGAGRKNCFVQLITCAATGHVLVQILTVHIQYNIVLHICENVYAKIVKFSFCKSFSKLKIKVHTVL